MSYLVIDTPRALRSCARGRAALDALIRMTEKDETQKQRLLEDVRRTAGAKKQKARKELVDFEKRRLRQLDRRRRALMDDVRKAIVRVATEIASERGALPVFERATLVVFDERCEITDEVVGRIDAETT